VLLACAPPVHAQLQDIQLPEPDMDLDGSLIQALQSRASSRSFSSDALPEQVLSDLLWAAFGINRPESGRRTAPSAINMQEIDIYLSTADGLYLYDPSGNVLKQLASADIRAATGMQDYVATAPLNLIYVADFSRMDPGRRGMTDEDKLFFAACDTGFIGQNVYLFCAVSGLATVVRAAIDKPALEQAMGLGPEQHVILAQTVGFPGGEGQ
jgi:SagB-type dehydrogenase family enzyme